MRRSTLSHVLEVALEPAAMWRWLKTSVKDVIENVLEIGKLNPATEAFFDQYCIAEDELSASRGGLQYRISHAIDEIRAKIEDRCAPSDDVGDILENINCLNAVLNARHEDSYSLVQYAIIRERRDVLSVLLAHRPGLDPPTCGKPLHLACAVNNVDLVKSLLEHGANVNSVSCVCYPSAHAPPCKRYDQFSMKWVKGCRGDIYDERTYSSKTKHNLFKCPLYFAIKNDNVDIMRVLRSYGGHMESTLHTCCRLGAYQCLEYVLNTGPALRLSTLDEYDRTPIQYAVVRGAAFVKRLLKSGASIFVKTATDESLLHLVLREGEFGCVGSTVSETLKYLLNSGLQDSVNSPDLNGSTPLHVLLYRVNGCVLSITNYEQRERVMDDIKHCVTILLQAGASTTIQSYRGESCLHILVNPPARRAPTMTQHKKFPIKQIDLHLISVILPIILQGGADVNLDYNETSVLSLLLQNTLKPLNTNVLDQYLRNYDQDSSSYFDRCVDILCSYGYIIDRPRRECLLHVGLHQLENVENISRFPIKSDFKAHMISQNVDFTNDVIESLLRHGVNPNSCKITQSDLNVAYHLLVKNVRSVPFSLVIKTTLLFLIRGADPNLGGKHMPMSVFRRSTKVHSPIFPLLHVMNLLGTKCSKLPFDDIWQLFHVFYSTMTDANVRLCVENYLEYDCYKFKNPKLELEEYFQDIVLSPRSLKQICSRRIYLQLNRKLWLVSELPLPTLIVKYLKSCDW